MDKEKTIDKNKILNRIIYLILIFLIILSSIYIAKSFESKIEAKKDRNLLNSINIEKIKPNDKAASVSDNEMDKNIDNKLDKNNKKEDSLERITQVNILKEEYKNIVGWLEIEDTNISYPVVQGNDNKFYLTHDYKSEKAERGAIFLDSNYNWNIEGNNFMIYGHYMLNGEMFTDLLKYIKEDFYTSHPTIRFTTDKEDMKYEIISVFRSKVYNKNDKNSFKFYNFINSTNEAEYNNFIENIKEKSLYDTGKTAKYGDQLITLTTCSYYTEDGRFVVVGRKI